MKSTIIFLLMVVCLCHCSEKKEAIAFTTLPRTEFNAAAFQLPEGIAVDSLKKSHDSCMGFSFDVNALFIRTRDTFSIGSVINRQSLKQVNSIFHLNISQNQIASQAVVISNPCYEERTLHFPLKSLLGDTFKLSLPGATAAVNKELNDAVAASDNVEMSTGSWVYIDMRRPLMAILDTIQSEEGKRYRQDLLDTSNMILTAVESVTDIGFTITTPKKMSAPLLALLQTKPSIVNAGTQTSLSLYYISDNTFELKLNGFFPVIGQFTKAEMK